MRAQVQTAEVQTAELFPSDQATHRREGISESVLLIKRVASIFQG